jgi:hypothetical protein
MLRGVSDERVSSADRERREARSGRRKQRDEVDMGPREPKVAAADWTEERRRKEANQEAAGGERGETQRPEASGGNTARSIEKRV